MKPRYSFVLMISVGIISMSIDSCANRSQDVNNTIRELPIVTLENGFLRTIIRKDSLIMSLASSNLSNASKGEVVTNETIRLRDSASYIQSAIRQLLKDDILQAFDMEREAYRRWNEVQQDLSLWVIPYYWEKYSGGSAGGSFQIVYLYDIENLNFEDLDILRHSLAGTMIDVPHKPIVTCEQVAKERDLIVWKAIPHDLLNYEERKVYSILHNDIEMLERWIMSREKLAHLLPEESARLYERITNEIMSEHYSRYLGTFTNNKIITPLDREQFDKEQNKEIFIAGHGVSHTEITYNRRFGRKFKDWPRPKKCPLCGGAVLPLVHGLMESSALTDSSAYDYGGQKRVIFAGCCVEEADWSCDDCGRRFVLTDGVLKEYRKNRLLANESQSDNHSSETAPYDESAYRRISRKIKEVEPGFNNVQPITCFWYDMDSDGAEDLCVLFDYDENNVIGWAFKVYSVDKEHYDLRVIGSTTIPRQGQIYKGNGYLIVTYGRMGREIWYKMHWNNGIKVEKQYENVLSSKNDERGRSEYASPEEPEIPVIEFNGNLHELLMTKVFELGE